MNFKKIFLVVYPIFLIVGFLFFSRFQQVEEAAKWVILKCPFHFVTGLLCPTCGMTRSFIAIFQGDLHASIRFHPIGAILFLSIFIYWFMLLFNKNVFPFLAVKYKTMNAWRWSGNSILFIYILWGVYRNF
ncbi:MAG: DUF2752 domain-containing protein [Bdellovibrionales bacterium]|nr:DUF2752 domain-containing protein [Bdellovibrionales bacterium]